VAATQGGGGFNPLFSLTCNRGHNSTKEVGFLDKILAIELKYYSVIHR